MDPILRELSNQVAPLLVQLLGALVLAVVSALCLAGVKLLNTHTTEKQRQLLYELAAMAVNFAEREGAGKAGDEKAKMAQDCLDRLLGAWGITTIKGVDVYDSLEAAIETAWRNEIARPSQLSRSAIGRDAAAASPPPVTPGS